MCLVALCAGILLMVFPASGTAKEPQVAASAASGIYAFDLAVGNRGYAVMAWSVESADSGRGRYRAKVFTRTRLPGRAEFGPRRFIGRASSDFIAAEIGGNGTTVVAWSGTNGYLTYSVRTPRLGWSGVNTVAGARVKRARISVATDGTVAMASLRTRSFDNLPSRVLGTVWRGRSERQHRWRVLSTDGETIGFYLDVVAGQGTRATVVWSGACESRGSNPASSWISMNSSHSTPARRVRGSGCVARGIDLQADRYGNQYMYLGAQLAIRKAGSPSMAVVKVGPPGVNKGGGQLSVSENGLATLIVRSNKVKSGLMYGTSRRGGPLSDLKELDNVRRALSGRRDVLLDVAPLPGGRLAMFWAEIWPPPPSGGQWRGLSVKVWHPGKVFTQPDYSELPPNYLPFPSGLATGSTGDSIAWWNLTPETDEFGNTVFWWQP
jgi:hypothetical protein